MAKMMDENAVSMLLYRSKTKPQEPHLAYPATQCGDHQSHSEETVQANVYDNFSISEVHKLLFALYVCHGPFA